MQDFLNYHILQEKINFLEKSLIGRNTKEKRKKLIKNYI